MFEEIITKFQHRKIKLETDNSLQGQIVPKYRSNCPIELTFSLCDLLVAIGTCRSVASTKSEKFLIALDFREILVPNDENELRVLINEDETPEQKQQISTYASEGLSLVIAERLYGLSRSTISRIKRRGNESKPDFMGFTPSLKIVWEAKGSTDAIRQDEIAYAKYQKANEPADIAFASLALLKSDSITEVQLEDPEALPLEGRELRRQLSRVMHYVNVFNFIGQPKMSRYFVLMGKRLERDRRFPEFDEKERLFEEISSRSIRISIQDLSFLGNIEKVEESTYFYVGFDERLLWAQGFLGFVDYEDDFVFRQERNAFAVNRDGICFGYLHDLGKLRDLGFTREINVRRISYYRDVLSILDLDDMFNFQLVEQVKYLFEREGFKISGDIFDGTRRYDLIVSREGKRYAVEVKKDVIIKSFEQLESFPGVDAALLVTTMSISDEDIRYARDRKVVIIDRKILKAILGRRVSIFNLLRNLLL
jgi:hypothetical protein